MAYFTEKELLERFEYYSIEIEKLLRDGEQLENVGNDLTLGLQISNPETFETTYFNKVSVEYTGFTLQEVREDWDNYIKIVHPATFKSMMGFLPGFYNSSRKYQTTHFLQYVKLYGEQDYSPVFTFTKSSALSDGSVIWLSLTPKYFDKIPDNMERLIEMDEFKLKHFKRFQQLTDREVEILTLLVNGYNNPKIADKLFLVRSTVATHRKNLKRKLELNSYRDLMRYGFAFDLIEV